MPDCCDVTCSITHRIIVAALRTLQQHVGDRHGSYICLRRARHCLNLRVVPHQSILVVKSSPACELAHAALICHVVWATTLSESARTRFDPLLELHTVVAQLRS